MISDKLWSSSSKVLLVQKFGVHIESQESSASSKLLNIKFRSIMLSPEQK